MIVHVLRFGFADETTHDEIAAIEAALRRLAATEPVAFSVVGQDLGDPAEGFTLSYCVAFDDLAALEHYMLHEPSHKEADFLIMPRVARMAAVDVTDDDDPALRATVGELWQRRIAGDPELAALFG
ncbi:MAG TPA: Dabb family protein [Baekduia sp.]|nr:Dabb family protein [Baekduia sp.]